MDSAFSESHRNVALRASLIKGLAVLGMMLAIAGCNDMGQAVETTPVPAVTTPVAAEPAAPEPAAPAPEVPAEPSTPSTTPEPPAPPEPPTQPATQPPDPPAPDPEPPVSGYPVADALPVMAITTDDGLPITSKEIYKTARYRVTDENGTLLAESSLEIRGRGNNTWEFDKKPYKLKLTNSTALLGMPANKHWVLLANYADRTLLRNEAAFHLGEQLGLAWTPRNVQVEVTLNGEYLGIYALTEQVRVGSQRVNIPELKATDTAAATITGGYLIEVDTRRGEIYCPQSALTLTVFCFNNPEDLTEPGRDVQRAYIGAYLDATEAAMFSGGFSDPVNGYAGYIDVDSAIDFYLVNELFKNIDANFNSSVFLFKPRGGKLFFGPLWDFDRAVGNAPYLGVENPVGWHVRTASWYARLFDDPAFDARVKARWKQLREDGVIEELQDFIDRREAWLSKVQAKNFERWDILYTPIGYNMPVGPWALQVSGMQDWLQQRVAWMDSQLL
jgi:CotH kinase protein